jgi:hypothetical protein
LEKSERRNTLQKIRLAIKAKLFFIDIEFAFFDLIKSVT